MTARGRGIPACTSDETKRGGHAVIRSTYLATLLSKRATSLAASCCGCDIPVVVESNRRGVAVFGPSAIALACARSDTVERAIRGSRIQRVRLVVWRLWTEGEHLGESNFRVSSFLVSSMPDLLSATKPKPLYTTSTVDTSGGPPVEGPENTNTAENDAEMSPPGCVSKEGVRLSTSSSSPQGSQDLAGDISDLSLARKNLEVMQRTKSGIKVSSPHFASSNPTSAVSSPLNSGMAVRDRDGKVVEKVLSAFGNFKRNPAQHRKRYGEAAPLLACNPLCSSVVVCLFARDSVDSVDSWIP